MGTYFVTDVELNGLDPSRHSMLSFASVAVSAEGTILGQFEANLKPRDDRTSEAHVMAFWQRFPQAYAAATTDPQEPQRVFMRFADWVESFQAPRGFAARPLALDGAWIDEYLKTYVGSRVLPLPGVVRPIFQHGGLDIESFVGGLFGWDCLNNFDVAFPDNWTGGNPHTHRAIDDALGYANVLAKALRLSMKQPVHTEDFLRSSRGNT